MFYVYYPPSCPPHHHHHTYLKSHNFSSFNPDSHLNFTLPICSYLPEGPTFLFHRYLKLSMSQTFTIFSSKQFPQTCNLLVFFFFSILPVSLPTTIVHKPEHWQSFLKLPSPYPSYTTPWVSWIHLLFIPSPLPPH